MKKISVLMTVYNAEKIINETLEALVKQTYTNLEIVIVNDGSTDESSRIIENFASIDKRIIYINRMENKGRVYSLNEGLNYCSGEWVSINDADDIYAPTRLENMKEFINRHVPEDFGVVGSASIIEDRVNGVKNYYKVRTGTFGNRVSRSRIYFGMPFVHSSFIYNKKALLAIGGFANEVTTGIDYFTLLKIAKNYPIYAYKECTVNRIINGENFFMKPKISAQGKDNQKIVELWAKHNYSFYSFRRFVKKNILKKL